MKKLARYLVGITVLFNTYGLVAWLYAYNLNGSQQTRVTSFLRFFPAIQNPITITITALLLTITSVVILFLFSATFSKPVFSMLLIIQALFLSLGIWQIL